MEKAKEDLTTALTVLNNHLLTKTFLVGERITQADIAVACTLFLPYEHVCIITCPISNIVLSASCILK